MATISFYVMLTTFCLAAVFFAMSTATLLSSLTGGHPRTVYWSRIFGGLGFVFFAVSGLLASPYLAGNARFTTPLLAAAFMVYGVWMLILGVRTRRTALKRK
ncbi:MAG: hypothetical protein HY711_07090 [Candidatus Melainabacteria bacterium]|nr:hypothetical protein [Candidatus Melainabacteria bacterium]